MISYLSTAGRQSLKLLMLVRIQLAESAQGCESVANAGYDCTNKSF